MTNLSSLLKTEITRLARKELRREIAPLKKALAVQRTDIAKLKKQLRVQALDSKRTTKPSGATAKESVNVTSPTRFRPGGMKSHREKLKLSAKDYGLLIGASALSVYKWEDGKVKPRPTALSRIAEVRHMGKREATRRLQALRA